MISNLTKHGCAIGYVGRGTSSPAGPTTYSAVLRRLMAVLRVGGCECAMECAMDSFTAWHNLAQRGTSWHNLAQRFGVVAGRKPAIGVFAGW